MEEIILRFPHIGRDIFDSLNNKSLQRCRKSSRLWHEFIDQQKFTWIRIIQKYVGLSNKLFPKSQELWRKMFCKTRFECIRNLAEEIHSNHYEDPIKGLTPLHYVLENCFAFSDKTYALELFKNIFDAVEDKNPNMSVYSCKY